MNATRSAHSSHSRCLAWCTLITLLLGQSLPAADSADLVRREPGLGRAEDVPALVAFLRDPSADVATKARACQQLAIVGNASAVDALASLLPDVRLNAYARAALELIPGPAADQALLRALPQLQGNLRIGVIHSLGARTVAAAVPPLTALVNESITDPATAGAALIALSAIPTQDVRGFLELTLGSSPDNRRDQAADACLRAAELALDLGKPDAAIPLYDAVRQAKVSPSLVLAGVRGAILARGDLAVPVLVEALASTDPHRWRIAVFAVREQQSVVLNQTLASTLPQAQPELQELILQALGDLSDPSVLPQVEALASSTEQGVRLAALKALGSLGGPSSIAFLTRTLQSASRPEEIEVATESLVRLPAEGTDASLIEALPGAPAEQQVRIIRVLGYRNARAATPHLLQLTADPNPSVSRAAFEALVPIASSSDVSAIVRATVACPDPANRETAEQTLYKVSLKNSRPDLRTAPLATALRTVPDPAARISLLQVLGLLADGPACRAVSDAYRDPSPAVRDTALRILANWPDTTPAPLLLDIFQTTDQPVHRTLALRGLVNLATLQPETAERATPVAPPDPALALQWLTAAQAALRPEADEQRLVISGLGQLNQPGSLPLLEVHLRDAAVARDAALAMVRVVSRLAKSDQVAARPKIERLLTLSQDEEVQRQATELLSKIPRA
jgi:HEAT repeat protein